MLIRAIARYAATLDIGISQLIFKELKTPAIHERPIKRITPETEARLLDVAKVAGARVRYIVPLINLALATAMRRGEICLFEWDDVDMTMKTLMELIRGCRSKGLATMITTITSKIVL